MDTFDAKKIVADYMRSKKPFSPYPSEPPESEKTEEYRWGEECAKKVIIELIAKIEEEQRSPLCFLQRCGKWGQQ
jgi:hypothetical protein